MPRVKQRTEALRERALTGALAILATEGAAGLTTRAVAGRAGASVPAVYEVFGDKAGIVREIFFAGFRQLEDELTALPAADDALAGLRGLAEGFRQFVLRNPMLAEVMFARPFADFDPMPDEAGAKVRTIFTQHVRDAVDARRLRGDPADIALVFRTLVEGLAMAEATQRLGGSRQSVDRRFRLGVNTLLKGFARA
ncbi:TetR/AcrR family transcriptional regulator [Kribbella sandramycini]|uniref:AcrR family transcriptional regulator n=1 Tax=Kribbella sandramycini TaxID=60450 RepID=A0A7Y4KWA0_9ACTN|nr:TetR/AcrR family transcriptional regulator [Kribbella sandramycini]MBB6567638.1 AcrR family transcriptional regulator [Kribbella sandramycini]NOL39759.1 TetR/AcrR family transcriptional regulator [Kribbella sandramycini]